MSLCLPHTTHTQIFYSTPTEAGQAEASEGHEGSDLSVSLENHGYERLDPETNSHASYETMGPGDVELDEIYIEPHDSD